MARRIAFLLIAAGFAAALLFATQREAQVECSVCLVFNGRSACRTGAASDRESAQRGAISAACAVLSSGVTQGIQCDNTPPRSLECSE